ncbi:MAG: choice-of-anchor U domain-containing protein, partial [Halobacteriota archaeon]
MEKERIKLLVVSVAVILLLSFTVSWFMVTSATASTTSINVEKWVKYKGEPDTEYRKKIDDANVCNTVTFKIAIQNDGSTPLTYIEIWDYPLDCDLEYIEDSASETLFSYSNDCPEAPQDLVWIFLDRWIDPGEYFNITFDAHVVKSGNDINAVNVYVEDDATGGWDEDEDTVWVTAPCVETATDSGIACFNTNAGTVEDLKAVAESTLPSEGKPDLEFKHGLFSFNITELTANQTVEVTITLPNNVPVGTQYWGYCPTPDNQTPHWYQIPMGSDDGDDVITITITDGYKIGDNDLSANGEIAALGGPGVSKVPMLDIEKSCKSSTVSLGGTVTYTIKYSNLGGVDLTNVVITENYPDGLTFISAVPVPDPGTNNKWTIGTLTTTGSGTITIKMKVPDSMSDLSYTESGSVSGEGIVMISKELSTKVEPFDLENIVTISGSYGATNVSATASAITTVSVSGSSLDITEHGSGIYESEEELSVSPEKMGITFDKTTNAEYSPTTFNCSDGFVMEVPSKWSQDICIKNYVKKSAIHKTITEATY